METLWADSILESPATHRFAEDSTTTVDGVGGGERSVTTRGDSTEMPGAIERAAESSKVEAGAAGAVLELGAQRPAVSKEQEAHPKMP